MQVKQLDERFQFKDGTILKHFYVDFLNQKYIFNIFVDKRYIESEKIPDIKKIEDVKTHFKPMIDNLVYRHIRDITKSLSDEQIKELKVSDVAMGYVTEFYDSREDTTWMYFQCAYTICDANNNFFGNMNGMHDMIRFDFIEPVKVTDELREKHSEIFKALDQGKFTTMSMETANEILSGENG